MPGQDHDSARASSCPTGPQQPSPPLPTLVSSNLSGGNGNGVIDPNECNELDLTLQNNAPTTASAVSATLVTHHSRRHGRCRHVAVSFHSAGRLGGQHHSLRIYTAPNFVLRHSGRFFAADSSSLGGVTNNFRMASGVVGAGRLRFPATNVVLAIPDNDTNGVDVLVPVAGLPGPDRQGDGRSAHCSPGCGRPHLDLFSPDNTRVRLAALRGGTNANYGLSCMEPTTFDDAAPTKSWLAFRRFSGRWRPQQSLTSFGGKLGTNANGLWRLHSGTCSDC